MDNSVYSKKVAVLCGGIGSERPISLESGKCVYDALSQGQIDVILADVSPDNLQILDDKSIDIFLPILHGQFGEDGQIQKILEQKNLLYAGSSPKASQNAFDKIITKQIFKNSKICTPKWLFFSPGTTPDEIKTKVENNSQKYVVKPAKQGSSVGIAIVKTASLAAQFAENVFSEYGNCIIEEFIDGAECTAGILAGEVLPIIEIRPKQTFYDYQAKYIDNATEFLFDTITDDSLVNNINEIALKTYDALEMTDFARVDFILSYRKNIYVLEANSIPGMTKHSLLPMAANKAKMSLCDLSIKILQSALGRQQKNLVRNDS